MTITIPALSEIPLFLKTYKELGFDRINFGYDRDTVPTYLQDHPEFTAALRNEITSAMSVADCSKIDSLRLSQLGLIK